MAKEIGVLFVCMGNICRSPTAEAVFTQLIVDAKLDDQIHCDSAGTYDFHPGRQPDPRSRTAAGRRGYDLDHLQARVVHEQDFEQFNHILAMDRDNYEDLRVRCPAEHLHKVELFLTYASGVDEDEVPDPYVGGAEGFDLVLDMIEVGARGLADHLRNRLDHN